MLRVYDSRGKEVVEDGFGITGYYDLIFDIEPALRKNIDFITWSITTGEEDPRELGVSNGVHLTTYLLDNHEGANVLIAAVTYLEGDGDSYGRNFTIFRSLATQV